VLYRAIAKDLEGIICKRKDEMYSVSGQWLKVLNPNYTQHEDRHEIFTSPSESCGSRFQHKSLPLTFEAEADYERPSSLKTL